jgi:glyoxylase-like metal-dependent hydrolase (beta-lactamase superfamily II)
VKVHHLNCATMCPRGGKYLGGEGGPLAEARLVCHTLAIEAGDQIVLVDTGLGRDDVASPKRLGQPFRASVRPVCDASETAHSRLGALGLDPGAVSHIVLTHMDVDHAGGLADFPNAEVHVFATELKAALNPPITERLRYVKAQWAHNPKWVEHAEAGEDWFGFESARLLPDLDAEVALVPLPGHSTGHSAVAVKENGGWMLHCGDSYFHRDEMATPNSCPPGLTLFQNIVGFDNKTRRQNQDRLRELARSHAEDVRLFCAHDHVELEREQQAA